MNDERFLKDWLRDTTDDIPDAQVSADRVLAKVPAVRQHGRWWPWLPADRTRPQPSHDDSARTVSGRTRLMFSPVKVIIGGALVFALGGVWFTAQPFEQQGSVPGAVEGGTSKPTTPAFFRLVEETDEPWGIVTTDLRFSGRWVQDEAVIYEGTPVTSDVPVIYPVGHSYDHVQSGPIRLENDEGAWQGWVSGFSWMSEVPWTEQMWFVGEGAYEGLSAVVTSRCCDGGLTLGSDIPEEEVTIEGIIFEGDVPRLWGEPPTE